MLAGFLSIVMSIFGLKYIRVGGLMETEGQGFWKKCSSCKKQISWGSKYYVCSVSTCNGQRTGYVFCTLECFERHLPGARHKQAGALERQAPREAGAPARILVNPHSATSAGFSSSAQAQREVLVIASRLKDYIQAKAQFNTSANVMDVLSDYLRILCDRAIDEARAEGRKTVLDRDFDFLKK